MKEIATNIIGTFLIAHAALTTSYVFMPEVTSFAVWRLLGWK